MRTFVIGDIHGALKALQQVLERAPLSKEDRIIFLGDYVDGWNESAQVVQKLISLRYQYDCIFLRGNHDEWCKEWLHTGVEDFVWLSNGGQSTKDSYLGKTQLKIDQEEHRKFFRTLHNYYIDDQNRGFVHGGFVSRKGLGHEAHESDYYWDRDLWCLALLADRMTVDERKSDKMTRFNAHKEIFIGHTTTLNWHCKPHYPESKMPEQEHKSGMITVPMHRANVWNLDTGCGFKGKLTIMDVDSKEFWQSDYSADLYPDYKGR